MITCIHCYINHYLTRCVLSLFNGEEIPYIPGCCRFKYTSLFALSTKTFHWNLTHIMSLGQDQNSNRVRLYHDWFYLYRVNFQWWCVWQNKWFIFPQEKQYSVWGMRNFNCYFIGIDHISKCKEATSTPNKECFQNVLNKTSVEKW